MDLTAEQREAAAYKAGRIDQRLDGFDDHFKVVNGSIESGAKAQWELVGVVQKLDARLEMLDARVKLAGRFVVGGVGLIVAVIGIANYLTGG